LAIHGGGSSSTTNSAGELCHLVEGQPCCHINRFLTCWIVPLLHEG
jgi:hypothetical protein